ncbi:hypothetical protein D6833_06670 [Candidatus Parcubacteria bacterium]|nr:MAG: hypothetical protein D6833_06670 [Candidatus Parcubacteria bacterium]
MRYHEFATKTVRWLAENIGDDVADVVAKHIGDNYNLTIDGWSILFQNTGWTVVTVKVSNREESWTFQAILEHTTEWVTYMAHDFVGEDGVDDIELFSMNNLPSKE